MDKPTKLISKQSFYFHRTILISEPWYLSIFLYSTVEFSVPSVYAEIITE